MSEHSLDNFHECYELLSNVYDQINGEDFYRYIFPNNENEGELHTDFSRPNAIYLYQSEQDEGSQRRLRRRIMLNDTWSDDYREYVECNGMTLCSGLTYHSRSNKLQYAQTLNALIFDLDGVGCSELEHVLERTAGSGAVYRSIPKPTFIVLSGRGLHLYYVFDEPIALYPNIKLQLKSLKHDLTFRIWEYKGTSQIESIQYQSIGQGFRMVGSINRKYGNTVTAFRIGDRVSLEFMNSYAIHPENRVDVNRPYRPSRVDRAAAAELYPEWYQRVVVEGNKRPKKWNIGYRKKTQVKDYALYEWWKRRVTEIEGGHRYFFLMCLVIYACKCDVPKKQLKADMQECFEVLRTFKHSNELTQADVDSAMECYSKDYYNFTIADIEILTALRIERNKRNGQKQEWHLEDIRSKKANMKRRGQAFKNLEGRPSKQQIVFEWQQQHPTGKKVDCHRDTGLDPKTIRKWWGTVPEQKKLSVYDTSANKLQKVSKNIVATCQQISAEQKISEKEAYEIYKQQPQNVQIVKEVSIQESLQQQADQLIFSASEYYSLSDTVKQRLSYMGIQLRVVPDDEYEVALMESYLSERSE